VEVVGIETREPLHRTRALQIAAALERDSAHPIAAAFAAWDDAGTHATLLREVAGEGLEGTIDGVVWRLGRFEFVQALAGAPPAGAGLAAATADGLHLGSAAGVLARFFVQDRVRPGVRQAVDELRSLGLDACIASGDERGAVASVAASLGIDVALHRLTPDGKIDAIRTRQRRGERVLMIGDGINDAPVLAAADVSCALGQGSAIAHAAADLVLLDDSLRAIPAGVRIARRALVVMRENLAWAFLYNLAAVPLAALGLIAPWVAAIGMSASSLAVVLNARRLAGKRRT